MELNWTTFILEVINFIVLVWILKRFLYQPVLGIISARREGIEKSLADAARQLQEAKAMEARYRGRLEDWKQERGAAREALHQELETERARLLQQLRTEISQERKKSEVLEQQRLADLQQQSENSALSLAEQFTHRLLERLAGPALEARLLELVTQDLAALSAEQLDALRQAVQEEGTTILVHSAFPLEPRQQKTLQEAFLHLLGAKLPEWHFDTEPELITGLCIKIGAWRLDANLRDELSFFNNPVHAES